MMLACAVCGLMGTGENGWAYFAGSVMLSALPLMMIGGVSLWIYRRVRKHDMG
jgi:hypothetical protein